MTLVRYKDRKNLDEFLEKNNLTTADAQWEGSLLNLASLTKPLAGLNSVPGVDVFADIPAVQVPNLEVETTQEGTTLGPKIPKRLDKDEGPKIGVAMVDWGIHKNEHVLVEEAHTWDFTAVPEANTFKANGSHGVECGYTSIRAASTEWAALWSLRAETLCQIIRAIEWGINNHPPSAAGGGIHVYCIPQVIPNAKRAQRQALEDIIRIAADRGAIVCVALGNDPPLMVPATVPHAITVGAFDQVGEGRQDDSVHVFDPPKGKPRPEAFLKPDVLAQFEPYPFWPHGGSGAGTSLAVAHVAGRVARWLVEHPTWKTDDVRKHMHATLRRLIDTTGKMPSPCIDGYPVID